MFKAILGSISGAISFLNIWKQGKERDKDRQAGEDRANVHILRGDVEASEEMRNIEHETRRLSPTARRNALGRFMPKHDD